LLSQKLREQKFPSHPSMAFSSKLDNFILSAYKPQNSTAPLSKIQPSSFLPCPSSLKPQKLPFRIRYGSTVRATSASSPPSTTVAEPEGIKVLSFSPHALSFCLY